MRQKQGTQAKETFYYVCVRVVSAFDFRFFIFFSFVYCFEIGFRDCIHAKLYFENMLYGNGMVEKMRRGKIIRCKTELETDLLMPSKRWHYQTQTCIERRRERRYLQLCECFKKKIIFNLYCKNYTERLCYLCVYQKRATIC